VVLCGSLASRRYKAIHYDIGGKELRFISRHKPLEGVLLPESPPRVLRDPLFIQCLVTKGRLFKLKNIVSNLSQRLHNDVPFRFASCFSRVRGTHFFKRPVPKGLPND